MEDDPREETGKGVEELRRLFEIAVAERRTQEDLRKRAEEERDSLIQQLEDKNEELKRYTYTVSHDLKSPLITIQGFLGLIGKSAREGNLERLESDIGRINDAVDRMSQLLNELLELSRIGRMVNPPEDVPVTDLATEAIAVVS